MKNRLTPKRLCIIVILFGGIKTRKNKIKIMKMTSTMVIQEKTNTSAPHAAAK
jgi:hypothetical protein